MTKDIIKQKCERCGRISLVEKGKKYCYYCDEGYKFDFTPDDERVWDGEQYE